MPAGRPPGGHLLVERAVAGEDLAAVEAELAAVEGRDPAARLAHDERARGHVPGREAALPEAVEAPAGEVAQVEGGRAVAPDGLRAHQERLEQGQHALRALAHVVGEARHQQRVLELRDVGDVDGLTVEGGAVPGGRGEGLAAHRVVHHARGQAAAHLDPDRDAEERVVVREVGGAVERVHEPAHRRGRRLARVRPGLLGQDGVSGETAPDALEQQGLGAPVVLGDEVDAALALGPVRAAVALAQHGAGRPGQFLGGVAQVARVGCAHRSPRAALWMQKRAYGQ